jgi:hypothetical protein
MGLHKFIRNNISSREHQSTKADKCPDCGRPKDKHNTIRNILGTLECYCGVKH